MSNLTQPQKIQLQAYEGATDRLNNLAKLINDANMAIAMSLADSYIISKRHADEAAYYDTMHYCDELISWFAAQGLDADQLLEGK